MPKLKRLSGADVVKILGLFGYKLPTNLLPKATRDIWKGTDSWEGKAMVTNLNVDTSLLQEAVALSGETTAEALVEKALRLYIQYHKQLQVIDLFGAIDYDETYDYKQQRQTA